MRATWFIAVNTFKETLRSRVLYNVLLFALGVIVLSVSFGEWSVFARVQVMEDFGLAAMSIAGLLLAIFIGVGMLGREMSSKTLYGVLLYPVPRYAFVLGKFAGLTGTLFLNFAVMTLVFWLTIISMGASVAPNLLGAVLLIWVEMAVLVAVAILFSTLTTPSLAAIFTLGFYIIGHYNDLLDLDIVAREHPLLIWPLKIIYYLVPNLEHFNIRVRVVYDLGVPSGYLWLALLYGLLFTLLYLLLAGYSFSRKDL